MNDLFMGKPASYWLELEKMHDLKGDFDRRKLIAENAILRGKVSFYEGAISKLVEFKEVSESISLTEEKTNG